MSVFVDTSALLAFLDADQPHHRSVAATFRRLFEEDRVLFTSNYVLVETCALVQRRLGLDALRGLIGDIVPLLETLWLDEELHEAALAAVITAGLRRLSLVDCTSFELMRRFGIHEAFALDPDFERQGFALLPAV